MDGARSAFVADIPADWAGAAALVAEGEARRVLVLGPRDAGKSVLCRVLLAAAAHRRRALLDADLGQKMVGPPACVTLGHPCDDEAALALAALGFVGTTDPVRGWTATIDAVRRLARGVERSFDLLVVNTGGLLAGPVRRLREAEIATLRPDLLLALGRHPVLDALVAAHPGIRAVRLALSPQARRKGEGERRRVRQDAFRAYFANASRWTAPVGELSPAATLAPGLLVGVEDDRARDVGLGIVTALDPAASEVTLLTPVRRHAAARLRAGMMMLDETFRETRVV